MNTFGTNVSPQNAPSDLGLFLFDVNIDIGQGINQIIQVFENSNVERLAADFCEQNNLDKRAIDVILQSIYKQKSQIEKKPKSNQE